MKLRPEDFTGNETQRNKKLQQTYFEDTLNLYKQFNIRKLPFSNITKIDFANLLGLETTNFILACAKASLVRQVQICMEISKNGIKPKDCVKSSSTCTKGGEVIQLMDWNLKYQQRVFNYPSKS